VYEGYLEFGGTEIANRERVVKYVELNAPQIPLRKRDYSDTLHLALGEDAYDSPAVDEAPWVDPNDPDTAKFFGVYPLAIQGGRDATRFAQPTESIGNGGVVGAEREAMKTMRVRALLVAETMAGLEAGNRWLNAALRPADCDDHGGSCGGAKLCYYSVEPPICDAWAPDYLPTYTVPFATDVAGSPLIIRQPPGDSLFKAWLDHEDTPPTTAADGVILRWGTVSRDDTSLVVDQYGPIIRRRTNLFVRPDFLANDAASWWGGAAFTVVDDGTGPDGRAYAHVPLVGEGTELTSSTGAAITPPAGDIIIALDLRAPAETPVTVELRSSDDDSVIASAEFLVYDEWRRYSLPRGTTSTFYIAIVSPGEYDVTGIVVEEGSVELPYLGGDVVPELAAAGYLTAAVNPEYEVGWNGTAHKSTSWLRWLGDITIGIPLGADFETNGDGTCNVWPFVDVIQGEIGGGRAAFAVRPKIQPDTQALPYERTMHEVRCIEGPIEIQTLPLKSAGAMRLVEFTLIAGKPWGFSATQTLIPPTKMSEFDTFEWPGEDDCPVVEVVPIVDPDCLVPPPPPRPPEIPAACIITEPTVQRYWFAIPAEQVSLWHDSVPRITIASGANAIRQVRVRAYPNPFDWQSDAGELPVDPCSWCSEFVLSYLPAYTELTVDAIVERAFAAVDGGPSQPADTLLYATDGGPMSWPALSCGIGYVFSIDVPELLLDDVTITFEIARKE
jgi:hypothetical protein